MFRRKLRMPMQCQSVVADVARLTVSTVYNMTEKPAIAHQYQLSPLAYIIPLSHAAKHLSHTVMGVFLGDSSPSSSSQIIISDAIPLIHRYNSLSPMPELALEMVETYAQERGSNVVGIYEASEESNAMSRIGERLLRMLRARYDGAFGLTVSVLHFEVRRAGLWEGQILKQSIRWTMTSSAKENGLIRFV